MEMVTFAMRNRQLGAVNMMSQCLTHFFFFDFEDAGGASYMYLFSGAMAVNLKSKILAKVLLRFMHC